MSENVTQLLQNCILVAAVGWCILSLYLHYLHQEYHKTVFVVVLTSVAIFFAGLSSAPSSASVACNGLEIFQILNIKHL